MITDEGNRHIMSEMTHAADDDDGSELVDPPADENDPGDPADSIEDPDDTPAEAEPDSPPTALEAD